MIDIYHGECLEVMRKLKTASYDLIYIDPPFNTGKLQSRTTIKTKRDADGDRVGFQGHRYRTITLGTRAFHDSFDDFCLFIEPRLVEAKRLLTLSGSFFLHLDYREVHYAKVMLDSIFGRECFMNEIIWAYDYGARATSRWSPKHDNILWYVADPKSYTFNFDEIERIPYMAPSLVGAEKAERGKTLTDTWWHTIVPTNGSERTGYPTQKPLGILDRIIKVHSMPGDKVLDFFAGSGTTGVSAINHGRDATLIDESRSAIETMLSRLAFSQPVLHSSDNAFDTAQDGLFSQDLASR